MKEEKEEKEIQHVIAFSVSDVEELPIGPERYIRTFRVRNLLGEEFVLTLRSESRLGLTLERESEDRVIPRPRPRRRRDDPRRSEPEA
jgi:hypothetical protein